jgi:hydrogenase expression/formation protein HypC
MESWPFERHSAAAGSSTCSSVTRYRASAERRLTMCLGIPGQVVDIVDAEQSLAKVDVNGVRRNISVRLLADDNLQVGDWVLVHVGFAMAKIDEGEAAMTLDQVQKMGADYVNEIEAFNASEIA